MIERSLKRRFLLFLALVALVGLSLQAAGPFSDTEAVPGPLWCVDASLAGASSFPTGTSGQGCMSDSRPSADPVWLEPTLFGTALPQPCRNSPWPRLCLAEGFPTEIFRPPVAAV